MSFAGSEGLSQPFNFQIGMVADISTEVAFDKLLGQPLSVRFDLGGGKKRFWHGICVRLAQGGSDTYFTTYQVASQPWAAAILRDFHAQGQAEIGAHLHPRARGNMPE